MTTLSRKLEVIPTIKDKGRKNVQLDHQVAAILNFRYPPDGFRIEGFSALRWGAERYFFAQRHRFTTKDQE